MRSGEDLVAGGFDGSGVGGGKAAQLGVGLSGRLLQDGECADDATGHGLGPDPEVLEGALRLRAPERRGGHADLAHGVVLYTEAIRLTRLPTHVHHPSVTCPLVAASGCTRAARAAQVQA